MDNNTVRVNIYIETSISGPARKTAAGAWLVEYQLKSGKPVTRGGMIFDYLTTENELVLELIIKAFSILTKTCCVRVFTRCPHILNTMNNHWLWQWQKNGWVNARGKLINHADIWKRCADQLEKHMTEWTDEPHTYSMCMRARINKELAEEHEKKEKEQYVEVPEWNTR